MNTQATDFWKNLGHARSGRTPPLGIAQAQRPAASEPAPAGWLADEYADAPTPDLSLIVPVHNEEAAIGPFLEALAQVSPDLPSLEIMFVDDGSAHNTEMAIRFAMRHDLRIRLLSLSRNFGKEAALCAGLDHATGAACVPMDVDLQDPPELLPQMVEQWRAGAQVVNARRVSRTGDGWLKRATARGFYRLYNALAERPIPEDVGDFRLLDREVVDVLKQLGERQRFNKGLFSWVGFEAGEVAFERPERISGRSAWTWWKLWNFALDGVFQGSTVPLRIWSYAGTVLALLGFAYAAFIFFFALFGGVDAPGYASTLILILIFGGLNLFALGMIGEYVGRIYTEVRGRPLYIVRAERTDPSTEGA